MSGQPRRDAWFAVFLMVVVVIWFALGLWFIVG